MRRFRLSPAMVVAVMAVVLSVTGSAVAATLITGKQIKDGTITQKDLAKALRAQIAKAGAPGAPGAAGPKGESGAKGDAGPSGTPDGYTRGEADARFLTSTRVEVATADPTAPSPQTLFSFPAENITVTTDGDADGDITFCVRLGGSGGFASSGASTGAASTTAVTGGVSAGSGGGGSTCVPAAAGSTEVYGWVWYTHEPQGASYVEVVHRPLAIVRCNIDLSWTVSKRRLACTATRF